ncbi:MAG: hypothetical protein JKY27_01810 [Magnetovibrio sp.]|nr:hypothetical protein [Magnetovibrio sp.]
MKTMMKRMIFAVLAVFALTVNDARAEMPQTDVDLISQMTGADNDKVLQALGMFYDLHASELAVQYADEQLTGAFFAVTRAQRNNAAAQKIAELQQAQKDKSAQRAALTQQNQTLRVRLEELSGVEFLDNLMVTPEAPLNAPAATASGVASDLAKARSEAWTVLETAQKALQEERLVLLDAQQRYSEGQKVPIGNHLRAMTAAELNFTKAVSAYRLLEAKIATTTGKSIKDVLAGL